ncbi:MAG TPA: single-stranded DNA-binding protein [Candidatus Paceibacterota bacterium]
MNLNKVFILGRLTGDPLLRSTPTGVQVANFSIATNRVWTDKTGGRKEETQYHNVVLWGRQAEIANRFLKKGALVLVEGRLQTRDWEDKQGQKRKTTEIIGERLQLGPRPGGFSAAPKGEEVMEKTEALPTIEIGDTEGDIKSEDLPF